MRFVTFQRRKDSLRGGLLLQGNRLLDLGLAYTRRAHLLEGRSDTQGLINTLRGVSSSIVEILRIGEESLTECYTLERAANDGELEDCCFPLGSAQLMSPVPDPPLVLHFNLHGGHALAEYRTMCGKADAELPEWFGLSPMFFFGDPCAAGGPSGDIRFPPGEEENDLEFQVAAVLCEDVHDVAPEDAEAAILGYTAACVWVARGVQRRCFQLGVGPSEAKSLGLTLGPTLVTKDELYDPEDLTMHLKRSGKELWSGKSGEGSFSIPEAISYASQGRLLPSGSIILAGAPAGASLLHHGSEWLKAGDQMELSIEGVGVMKHSISERGVVGNSVAAQDGSD